MRVRMRVKFESEGEMARVSTKGGGTMHTEGRGMEKQKSISLSVKSVNQSVSQPASKPGKQGHPLHLPIHARPFFHPQRGPPGPNSQSCQITSSLPQKRSGARRVEGGGWRIEDRGSTNQRPGGPHPELDTNGSLTRSSKGTPRPYHVGIRRRGGDGKGGVWCGVGH